MVDKVLSMENIRYEKSTKIDLDFFLWLCAQSWILKSINNFNWDCTMNKTSNVFFNFVFSKKEYLW